MVGLSLTSSVTTPAEGVSVVSMPVAWPSVSATAFAVDVLAGSESAYPEVTEALLVPIQTTNAPPDPFVSANCATLTLALVAGTVPTYVYDDSRARDLAR